MSKALKVMYEAKTSTDLDLRTFLNLFEVTDEVEKQKLLKWLHVSLDGWKERAEEAYAGFCRAYEILHSVLGASQILESGFFVGYSGEGDDGTESYACWQLLDYLFNSELLYFGLNGDQHQYTVTSH